MPEVRLVDEDGSQIGVVETDQGAGDAQRARSRPRRGGRRTRARRSCRVLDYSKYKYEQEQKAKAARKHQQQVNVREIKLRPKIADHDYETKKGHVERFLEDQDKVKVTIMFRGREQAHPERGRGAAHAARRGHRRARRDRAAPQQEGRNMTHAARAGHEAPTRRAPAADAAGEAPPPPRGADARSRGAAQQRSRRAPAAPEPAGDEPPAAAQHQHAGASASIARLDAEDEDPFGRQEALPQDRAPASCAARRAYSSHILEKKSPKRKRQLRPSRSRSPRPTTQARQEDAGQVSRAINAVARTRRKKRKVLKQAKGYCGRKHSSYRFAKEQCQGRATTPTATAATASASSAGSGSPASTPPRAARA